VIYQLYLRGGSKGAEGGGDTGGDSFASDSNSYLGTSGDLMGAGGMLAGFAGSDISAMLRQYSGAAGAAGAAGEGAFTNLVEFNANDELGEEVALQEEGAEEADVTDFGADPLGMGLTGLTGVTGLLAGQKVDRYVEKKPEWKTRGFYLEVVMDHRKVPNLLVALTNAGEKWGFPIRIGRVHQADFREEDMISAATGTGGLAGLQGIGAGGDLAAMAAAAGFGGADAGTLAALASSMGLGGMPGLGGLTGTAMRSAAPARPVGPGGMNPEMLSMAGAIGLSPDMLAAAAGGNMSGIGPTRGRTTINRMPNLGMAADGVSPGMRTVDPLTDPMLANVAIDGWLVILNPPPAQEPVAAPDQAIADPLADQAPEAEAAEPAETTPEEAAPPAEDQPAPSDDAPAAEQDADNRKEE
jgi:hypothetical protein